MLPGDIRKWIEVARSNRGKYSELKAKYVVDPHQNEDMSLTVNNPLSQEEKVTFRKSMGDIGCSECAVRSSLSHEKYFSLLSYR